MSSAKSIPFKFSANLDFMFRQPPTIERYALASKFGFKGVETGNPYLCTKEELKMELQKHNLTQVLINTPVNLPRKEFGFAAVPNQEERFFQDLKIALTYAETLNCKMIHIMAGLMECTTTSQHDTTFVENLRRAAPILQNAGIQGVIEPINPESLPNYYLADFNKAISIIERVGSPNIGLLLDLFHLQKISGNLTNNIKRLLPYTKHIQLAQSPNRDEPGEQGEVNFKYIFELLHQQKYSRWMGLEYTPSNPDNINWMNDCGVTIYNE